MKKLILKAVLLCMMSSFCVGTALADESDWTFDPATGTISSYEGPGGHVEIPETYMGFTVTQIGQRTFTGNTGLSVTSVTMPDTITHIGEDAFDRGENITSMNLSKSLIYVDDDGLSGISLTEWIFPDSLTTLYADNRTGTTSINTSNTTYIRLPANTVSGTFDFGSAKQLTQLDIPDEFVGQISTNFNVDKMSEVTIPGGVTLISSSPARYEITDAGLGKALELPVDEFTYKVYDNTPAHFFCVEKKLNFELLGEWVQPTAGSSSSSSTSTPSTSTPSISTPSTSTPSTSDADDDGDNTMMMLGIIGGVTVLLCVIVVVVFLKKR